MSPTEDQLEILKELINIGVGLGAGVLNTMLSTHIDLQVPELKTLSYEDYILEIEKMASGNIALVDLGFGGAFSGSAQLIFPIDDVSKLVNVPTGKEDIGEDFDSIRAETFTEIGNVVLNSVVGSLANVLKLQCNYSVPNYLEGDLSGILKTNDNMESARAIILAKTKFTVQALDLHGGISLYFGLESSEKLLSVIDNMMPGAGQQATDVR